MSLGANRISTSFISELPADGFLPWELGLREQFLSILDHVIAPFPLEEWLEERVGMEIGLDSGLNGKLEIRPVDIVGHVHNDESTCSGLAALNRNFLDYLPSNGLLKEEEDLLDSLYECLASIPEVDMPKLKESVLIQDELVQQRRQQLWDNFVTNCAQDGIFMEGKVPHWKQLSLHKWIRRRVSEEINVNSKKNIVLSHAGQKRLDEKRRHRSTARVRPSKCPRLS